MKGFIISTFAADVAPTKPSVGFFDTFPARHSGWPVPRLARRGRRFAIGPPHGDGDSDGDDDRRVETQKTRNCIGAWCSGTLRVSR